MCKHKLPALKFLVEVEHGAPVAPCEGGWGLVADVVFVQLAVISMDWMAEISPRFSRVYNQTEELDFERVFWVLPEHLLAHLQVCPDLAMSSHSEQA